MTIDVSTWDAVPASNTTIDGVSITEGTTTPSSVNNALRAIMAGVKTFWTAAVTLTGTETLTNKTLTNPAINGAALNAATVVTDTGTPATNSVGFRGMPQNAQTASYTLAMSDNGKMVSITTGGVVIPANASIAFPIGATCAIYNDSGSTQAITITTDTLRQLGTTNTGARTIAAYGMAVVTKTGATTWGISGNVT